MWAAIPLSALPSPLRRSGGGCGPSATEPAGLRAWLCGAEFVLHDLVVQAPALARPAPLPASPPSLPTAHRRPRIALPTSPCPMPSTSIYLAKPHLAKPHPAAA